MESDELSTEDSKKIVDEIIHGTPPTPKRRETLRRADQVYEKHKEKLK